MAKTIGELIMEYFKSYPNQELSHGPVVDWVTEQWLRNHDKPPRDPWRMIRQLHQYGQLIKVRKGVYKFDPNLENNIEVFVFSPKIRNVILERDDYQCVVCGRGRKDGVELVVDHILPKDKGGTNDIQNGQTLCTEHNLLKKNYSQSEAGKRYFIKMYEKALENNDDRIIKFCKSVFDVYDEHKINGHIPRPNSN